MVPLLRSGSAIGMVPLPPIRPYRRCNPPSAHGRSMRISVLSRQAYEKEVGTRLRRVQKAQATRGACPNSFSSLPCPSLTITSGSLCKLGITRNTSSSKTSYLCTIIFLFRIAGNYTSCPNQWKDICISSSSSSPAMAVAIFLVALSPPLSVQGLRHVHTSGYIHRDMKP